MLLVIALVSVPFSSISFAAAPKGTCTKLNKQLKYNNQTFVCAKINGKLIWKILIQSKKIEKPQIKLDEKSTSTVQNIELTNESEFASTEMCRIKSTLNDSFNSEIRIGFDRSQQRIPNIKNPRMLFIYINYLDSSITDNPILDAKRFYEPFVKYIDSVSYGQSHWQIEVFPTYIEIPHKMTEYDIVDDRNYNVFAQIRDAIKASENYVNLTQYDQVVFIPSSDLIFPVGPALQNMSDRIEYLTSKDGILRSVVVAGKDWRNSNLAWIWLTHETIHNYGLPHNGLYTESSYTRPIWDVMDAMDTRTSELFSWTRWLIGWLKDNQVHCINKENPRTFVTTHELSPVEVNDSNLKMIAVPIDANKIVVIESRRNAGMDTFDSKYEGLVAYLVDTSKGMDQGAITMLSDTPKMAEGSIAGNLTVGGSLEKYGVTIKYLSRNENFDYVQVVIS